MEGVRRALPVAPAEWERLAAAVAAGVPGPAARRLGVALRPAVAPSPPGVRWLSPRLLFVRVDPEDVAVLGATARGLGARLLPCPSAPVGVDALSTLVWDLALVHGLLDLDPGEDAEILRYWGADGPLLATPPPVAVAAHHRLAARVHTLWDAGRHG
jgi:hypothetical protein